ncbi:MAG TPA: hypothetical protein VHX66_06350 [Solirubrobacteraceae bacterium]|nr:hypothetical protein [Solirubrobacteraceae bacterium]
MRLGPSAPGELARTSARRRSRRRLAAFAAAPLLAALGLGAVLQAAPATAVVRGAAASGAPVAVIGSAAISDAAFTHWLTVANDSSQASSGVAAPPLPLPPGYTACVAALQKQAATAGDTPAQLRKRCAQSYRGLVKQVMSYLVQAIWVQGEANARGLTVTRAQVDAGFAAQRRTSKPSLESTAALDAFMAKSGQTLADLHWRTRLNLLATAISRQVEARAGHVTSAQVDAYYAAHRARFKGESHKAAAAKIRQLIKRSQQTRAGAALTRKFATTWRRRTVCRSGFDATSCSKVAATIAPNAAAPYPGAIALPPARAQTRTFTPSG